MPRRPPDVWLREESVGDDFFAYMDVPSAFRDSPASVEHHDLIYFDTMTRIALHADRLVMAANLSIEPDSPRIVPHVERMRQQIGAGQAIELAEPGPFALLATRLHDNYYHFLCEDLGRLGFYDALAPLRNARFPVPQPKPWQRELYALAGIEARLLSLPKGVIALRDVWVAPRGLAKIAEFRSRAWERVATVGADVADAAPAGPSRIYVTRVGTRHRRPRNEEAVRALVTARGFVVVAPETMPVAEQIRLFRGAGVVLGVFGAGLTNAAFMRPGSLLLEIASAKSADLPGVHNAIFSSLAGLQGLRYGLLTAPAHGVDRDTHDFTVPLEWLDTLIAR
ncbi:MAG: glycosyltransferase family 61 protein, partial [Thermomicrobiales bacterium]